MNLLPEKHALCSSELPTLAQQILSTFTAYSSYLVSVVSRRSQYCFLGPRRYSMSAFSSLIYRYTNNAVVVVVVVVVVVIAVVVIFGCVPMFTDSVL